MASFDEVIPPGKAGTIKAGVKTEHYRGPVSKSVTVTTNDAAATTFYLTVKARIVGSVELLPNAFIGLTPGQGNRPGRVLVRRDETEQGTLVLSDVRASASWLTATARRIDGPEPPIDGVPETRPGDWVVELSRTGAVRPGSYSEQLIFKTGLAREPEVTVPVNVFIRAAVSMSPPELTLPPATPSAPGPEGIVLVSLRPDIDPSTVAVATETKGLSARLEPTNATTFRLHVAWTAEAEPATASGTVTLRAGPDNFPLQVRVARPPAPPAVPAPPR